ncbi:MAG TPA: ABC transporter permease [Candidatus Rubrimentiphilum sp.]|nr:ABC transporter permease [Candidatus Rubrimentiphilum sp.]
MYELVLRDLRLRYRGSLLGFGWTLLNPLLFMAIYTLVFSIYLRVNVPHYPAFLLAGIVPWGWLAGAMSQGTSAIIDGRMYVGKTLLPTEILVIVPVISNGVNFLFSLPILFLFAILLHVHLGLSLIMLPVVILIQFAIVLGLVMLTATFNVFYRDLQQLILYVLTLLFYLTPIFYTPSFVPEQYQYLIVWNPFAALIGCYHAIFYSGTFPTLYDLTVSSVFAFVILGLAQTCFSHYKESFSEYV